MMFTFLSGSRYSSIQEADGGVLGAIRDTFDANPIVVRGDRDSSGVIREEKVTATLQNHEMTSGRQYRIGDFRFLSE